MFLAVTVRMGLVLTGTDPAMNHITSLLIYIASTAAYFLGIVTFWNSEEIVIFFNSLIQIEERKGN